MCGFAGYWSPETLSPDASDLLARMNDVLTHRGPDDDGLWCDADAGIALGHRRLAIVDLSVEGHQPMSSASGRYVIAFNGEIYNFLGLRRDLEGAGARFRGHSDTEVMLAAIERWGIQGALPRLAGMFAFALWDRERRELHLARDRAGEKPLYVTNVGGTLLFGSQLSSLRAHPRWRGEIDRGALTSLMRYSYIPAPHTIHVGVHKVLPGTVLTIRRLMSGGALERSIETYWSARAVAEAGLAAPLEVSDGEAVRLLDDTLRTVVGQQMVADVPLGAFLSGGVDSTTVVAIMQSLSSRPVRTLTIGFHESGYDEANHARAVANHIGTEHTEQYVTPREAQEVIPRLPWIYDEPFADSSQIPTLLVAQLARRSVTVSLSGDGGDELFAGYGRYLDLERSMAKNACTPSAARPLVRAALGSGRPWAAHAAASLLGLEARVPQLGDRLERLAGRLTARDATGTYRQLVSYWPRPQEVVIGAREVTPWSDAATLRNASAVEQAMLIDFCSYLPDDILVKVDRATMAVGLESRAPLIDHRVVELAWRLPLSQKVRNGQGKHVLRGVLDQYVPPTLMDRPKQGFAVPVGSWLRGPLREWADDLLEPRGLAAEGYLEPRPVARLWAEHSSGRQDWTGRLWPVLMFQGWLRAQR